MPEINSTILITDDELSIRRSLNVILRKKYNILTSATGAEALVKINKEHVDLILLDLNLPDTHGLEVLRQVKQIDENIMVIIITAVRDTKTAVEAMKMGAYDYITKPFDISELRALVDKALEKRALIKENVSLRSEAAKESFGEIIGRSNETQEIF